MVHNGPFWAVFGSLFESRTPTCFPIQWCQPTPHPLTTLCFLELSYPPKPSVPRCRENIACSIVQLGVENQTACKIESMFPCIGPPMVASHIPSRTHGHTQTHRGGGDCGNRLEPVGVTPNFVPSSQWVAFEHSFFRLGNGNCCGSTPNVVVEGSKSKGQ